MDRWANTCEKNVMSSTYKLSATPGAKAAEQGSATRAGTLEYVFWAFLLIAVGRIGELVPGLSGLPIGKVTLGLTVLLVAAHWRRMPSIVAPIRPMVNSARWLATLALLLTPFSFWPGASVIFLYQDLLVLIAATAIAYMMSRSWGATKGTLLVLVISGLVLSRAALSSYTGGRAAADTMYDTNDLGYLIATVLPLAVAFAVTAQTTLRRVLHILSAIVLLVTLLLTQSRGGFLALITLLGLALCMPMRPPKASNRGSHKPASGRLAVVICVACLAPIVWTQLPGETRERLSTLMHLSDDYNLDPTDVTARGQIWKRGIGAAFKRPVGYGPYSFPMVDLRFGGRMMAPHNSFVEVLVELGFVGLLLHLRMYYLAWRNLGRVRKSLVGSAALSREQYEQLVFARALQFALAGNAVASFFLTMAYSTLLWVLFGVCMGIIALAHNPAEQK
jgi:O-antigen ligase